MLPHDILCQQPTNPKQLKLTLCRKYLLLYILKKNVRSTTTIRNITTAVTAPAIVSEFAERDAKFKQCDVELEERGTVAKITKKNRVIDNETVDFNM